MARTFRATLSLSMQGKTAYGKVPIDETVVEELGLRPGETLRASMRGTQFTGKVHGSMNDGDAPIRPDATTSLGLREGQGVRVTVHGRT